MFYNMYTLVQLDFNLLRHKRHVPSNYNTFVCVAQANITLSPAASDVLVTV